MEKFEDLKNLVKDYKNKTHEVECSKCGKKYNTYAWFMNIKCYICPECTIKEYEANPVTLKNLIGDGGKEVLDKIDEICRMDITDDEFRKEINNLLKEYNTPLSYEQYVTRRR